MDNNSTPKTELNVSDLSVIRGQSVLFSGLSFTLKSGQVLWIQGPNGIGKTTLLRVAAGLARPQKGLVSWNGPNGPQTSASLIAFQGHKNSLKPRLSVSEILTFWMKLSGYAGALEDVLGRLDLSGKQNLLAGQLSRGQQGRLALARLVVSQKPIWILDEPLSNMDNRGRDMINSLITAHVKQGGSALISSHESAEKLSIDTRVLTLTTAQNMQKGAA